MAAETNKRDLNRVTVSSGVTDDANLYPTQLRVDPTTLRLKTNAILAAGTATIGSIKITDGTETATVNTNNLLEVSIVQNDLAVTTPTVYNLTLTSADTEYSQALPANTKEVRFRCRTIYDVRYAWVTGKVATPTAPYLTLPAGSDYYSDNDNLAAQTLYLASSQAGVIIEIECWV